MKKLAALVMSIALVAGGVVVGWELKQWHSLMRVWAEKVAAYDFVGPQVMERVMIELTKQKILKEREENPVRAVPVRAVPVHGSNLPSYTALQRGQHAA